MDRTDRKLLALLQTDCTLSIAQLAEQVGLSATPCWKRIQRLEADGVIERRVALVDPEKVGLGADGVRGDRGGGPLACVAGPVCHGGERYAGGDGGAPDGG